MFSSTLGQAQLTQDDCQHQLESWRDAFAFSSPLASIVERSSLFRLSSDELESHQDFIAEMKKVSVDLPQAQQRDLILVERMHERISQVRSDELLLIHVGVWHAVEYFLKYEQHAETRVSYAQPAFHSTSPFGSDAFREVFPADGVSSVREGVLGKAVPSFFSLLSSHFDGSKSFEEWIEGLRAPAKMRKNVIFIADFHGIDDPLLVARLPSLECFVHFGWKKISLLVEGVDHASPQTFENLADSLNAKHSLSVTTFSAPIQKRILNGDINIYPLTHRLLNYVKRSEQSGISANYVGIDLPEYDIRTFVRSLRRESDVPSGLGSHVFPIGFALFSAVLYWAWY